MTPDPFLRSLSSTPFFVTPFFVRSSPAFVRASEGNGVAQRFIRTLKEQLRWARTFRTVEDLREAPQAWLVTYNGQWLVERHGFRSSAHVRRALLTTQEAA